MTSASIIFIPFLILLCSSGIYFYFLKNAEMPELFRKLFRKSKSNGIDRKARRRAMAIANSPSKIDSAVRHFVFDVPAAQYADYDRQLMRYLGDLTYPAALSLLSDPHSTGDLLCYTTECGRGGYFELPFTRLCGIFYPDTPPPTEAAPLLSRFLDSDNSVVRMHAARAIGSIGQEHSIPDLRKAMQDEEQSVRHYAMVGIDLAISSNRIEALAQPVFFDFIAGIWPKGSEDHIDYYVPLFLLSLHREAAIERLLRDDVLSLKFKGLPYLLDAFCKHSVVVPRDKLLTFIELSAEFPNIRPFGPILSSSLDRLGVHRDERDLKLLEGFLTNSNWKVERGAVNGLYAYHDYFGQVRDPSIVEAKHGWESLTQVERHVCAVERLRDKTTNGGFGFYYSDTAGDKWEDALSGLKAIGAEKRFRVMGKSIAVFGETPPPKDSSKRRKIFLKVSRSKEYPLSELDSEWRDIEDEPFDRLLFHYNMANRDGRPKE